MCLEISKHPCITRMAVSGRVTQAPLLPCSPLLHTTHPRVFVFCLHVCLADFLPPATKSLLVIPQLLFNRVDRSLPLYWDELCTNTLSRQFGHPTTPSPLHPLPVLSHQPVLPQLFLRQQGCVGPRSAGFLTEEASDPPRLEWQRVPTLRIWGL